ncbi:MAG: hypothetical protein MK322_10395, partial [Pseudomonadales bacterium]|nr:hypothetical protein [Pseudomonadales bacterium]
TSADAVAAPKSTVAKAENIIFLITTLFLKLSVNNLNRCNLCANLGKPYLRVISAQGTCAPLL